jgi:hypothetical protein
MKITLNYQVILLNSSYLKETLKDDTRNIYNIILDKISYKSTQQPNTPKPTKKPGTYLQSIWDIYFP